MWKDKGLQIEIGWALIPMKQSTVARGSVNDYLIYKESGLHQTILRQIHPLDVNLFSTDDIVPGDWFLPIDGCIEKAKGNYFKLPHDRKIIASNNPSLNLPSFSDSFLEEYVKRYNSKKSLEVEVDCNEVVWQQSSDRYDDNDVYCNGEKVASFDYRLQEEEMDRFTDRLGKQPKVNSDNTIHIRFKEEKMYSRSEIEKLCRRASYIGHDIAWCDELHKELVDNWIKENLK